MEERRNKNKINKWRKCKNKRVNDGEERGGEERGRRRRRRKEMSEVKRAGKCELRRNETGLYICQRDVASGIHRPPHPCRRPVINWCASGSHERGSSPTHTLYIKKKKNLFYISLRETS